MSKENYIQRKLENGQPVLGTWSIIPSAITADVISSAGLDFIIIDAEHGPISFETAQEMAIACESRGVSPIMRVGGVVEADILKALDIGMHGIQIPNIESSKDVQKVIQLSKYPPIGKRGFSPFTRAGNYSLESATTHTKRSNSNTLVGINIEGQEAIENIDDILSIENLDIIFVGLFDLSKALGIPGQVENSKVIAYLKELTDRISQAGKYPGTIASNPDQMTQFLKMGVKYLTYLVDCEMLRKSYTDIKRVFDET